MKHLLPCLGLACSLQFAIADGPKDNLAEHVRSVPPPGIAIGDSDRAELQSAVDALGNEINDLKSRLVKKPALEALLPDVQIFHNAVRYALTYNEIFATNEIAKAKTLLKEGMDRAQSLRDGKAPWTAQSGLVVRGYRSKIDDSVQPYGLVIPNSFPSSGGAGYRLDTWFHGRGENLSEINFIADRERSRGDFAPANAIVLHLYGRYCNANKFAGEIDLLEALENVKMHYPIDEDRIIVRGFSMGGAACWQFATHYAGMWAGAAPGAGFAETADFLKVFQKEAVNPPWYEQKLWHMYDSTDYAVNLFNCPTVAYSGEIDNQKQAADMMAKALAEEGIQLAHIIGPKTAHAYEPKAKLEVARRIDSIAEAGRDPLPRKIKFTTWTLRYNQMRWVTVDGLEEHWERARVNAEITGPAEIKAETKNVSALTFSMPPGHCPFDVTTDPVINIDGTKLTGFPAQSDRSWTMHFRKTGGTWQIVKGDIASSDKLEKVHGLQGPIDDAFMESFVMVTPTGTPLNPKVGSWVASEQKHAIEHWRKQFRGEARVMADSDLSDAEIAKLDSNLVLWGDPQSNKVLARIADKLPIKWTSSGIAVGEKNYGADHFAPVLVYPNPLNPKHYIVLNSGFTYREYDYLNNARQVSKLPDFAIIDLNTPVNARTPGGIATAGFFGEHWELLPPRQ
jgi:hypothetical protein